MINKTHFLSAVIRPVIISFGMGGKAAETLLLGTALVESNLVALKQYDDGPALGVYQMEPNTHDDIWKNYLERNDDLAIIVAKFMVPGIKCPEQLKGNLYYATAMTRLHYRRVKQALPLIDDISGMSQYHKQYYNTIKGKADARFNEGYFAIAAEIVNKWHGEFG